MYNFVDFVVLIDLIQSVVRSYLKRNLALEEVNSTSFIFNEKIINSSFIIKSFLFRSNCLLKVIGKYLIYLMASSTFQLSPLISKILTNNSSSLSKVIHPHCLKSILIKYSFRFFSASL